MVPEAPEAPVDLAASAVPAGSAVALAAAIPVAAVPDAADLAAAASAAVEPAVAVPDEDNNKIWARCEPNRSVPILLWIDI